ncbi:MAG: MoxR family ATPase [Planctomycetota bacterium]
MPAPSASFPLADRLTANVARVLLGKKPAIQLATIALLAEGHLLIEDNPGVGKTLLARALAKSLDLPFQRVQCTADLLPADILGGHVYQPATGDVVFRPGPVFTSVLVADELNRTPPRTQSALLQCMQERKVTIDRTTHDLPDPFFVVATQNPQTVSGTYPLPESQLDRFALRIELGYLDPEHEALAVARADGFRALEGLTCIASADDVRAARQHVRGVRVDPSLVRYMVELAQRTRAHSDVRVGVSTRGAQALHRTCQARALLFDRDYVSPDDVQTLAAPALAHRLSGPPDASAAQAVILEILAATPVPE